MSNLLCDHYDNSTQYLKDRNYATNFLDRSLIKKIIRLKIIFKI